MDDPRELEGYVIDSRDDEWQFFVGPETWVHTPNRELMIKEVGDRTMHDAPDWVNLPDGESVLRGTVRVYHNGTPFDEHSVNWLDGRNVVVPSPTKYTEEEKIERYHTPYEAALGRIMSGPNYDELFGQMDVVVRGTFPD